MMKRLITLILVVASGLAGLLLAPMVLITIAVIGFAIELVAGTIFMICVVLALAREVWRSRHG